MKKIDWNNFTPELGSDMEETWKDALESARTAKYTLQTKDLVVFEHSDLGLLHINDTNPIIVYVMQVLMDRGYEVVCVTRAGVVCKRIK